MSLFKTYDLLGDERQQKNVCRLPENNNCRSWSSSFQETYFTHIRIAADNVDININQNKRNTYTERGSDM